MIEIYDAQTGEHTLREMTDAEIAEVQAVISATESVVDNDAIGF